MRGVVLALLLAAICLFRSTAAVAFPGVMVGKSDARRAVRTTHLVVMQRGDLTVVTVMPDYEGPLTPFALLLPVAGDVTTRRLRTVKRELVARLDEVSAPRFHAFFEMDPCEPGEPEQSWQTLRPVAEPGIEVAGRVLPTSEWTVSRDVSTPIQAVYKGAESEYSLEVVSSSALTGVLRERGYRVEPELSKQLAAFERYILAEVDPSKVELVSADRAQLAGVQYFTARPLDELPVRLGLRHAPRSGYQDLFVHVMHPTARFDTPSYPTIHPPTNLEVRHQAREQVGPLYNAIFDRLLAKMPLGVVVEYIWDTAGCGEPCINAPLEPRELLSLGGEVFEARLVSAGDRNPAPPRIHPAAKSRLEAELASLPPRARARRASQYEEVRRELARRRALFARQRYVLTRLHKRYTKKTLPVNLVLRSADGHLAGGVGVPEGRGHRLPVESRAAERSRFQLRFTGFHEWGKVPDCASPERWRWGKRWEFQKRVRRKTLAARDLPNQPRHADLEAALLTPIPRLGLQPAAIDPDSAAPTTTAGSTSKRSNCACGLVAAPQGTAEWALLAALVCWVRRRHAGRCS